MFSCPKCGTPWTRHGITCTEKATPTTNVQIATPLEFQLLHPYQQMLFEPGATERTELALGHLEMAAGHLDRAAELVRLDDDLGTECLRMASELRVRAVKIAEGSK